MRRVIPPSHARLEREQGQHGRATLVPYKEHGTALKVHGKQC
jgi:hypothetical protein